MNIHQIQCYRPEKNPLSLAILIAISALLPQVSQGAAAPRGIIYYSPHTIGHAQKLLRKQFTLVAINRKTLKRKLPPKTCGVIVGAKDLADPEIAAFVRKVYQSGLTTGVVTPAPDDAEDLRAAAGRDFPVSLDQSNSGAPLVAIREDNAQACCERHVFKTNILSSRDLAQYGNRTGNRRADERELKWLKEVFREVSRSPVSQTSPERLIATPQATTDDITQLANSTVTNQIQTNSWGSELQVTNSIYTARSFLQYLDYYFVSQWITAYNPKSSANQSNITYLLDRVSSSIINRLNAETTPGGYVVQFDPGTTLTATTYKNSVDQRVSTEIGWKKGFIATVSYSATITNSTTTTVPQTVIDYTGDIGEHSTRWSYSTNGEKTSKETTYQYPEDWIWSVPLDDLSPGQEWQTFSTEISSQSKYQDEYNDHYIFSDNSFTLNSTFPMPFQGKRLEAPVVQSVDAASAKAGDKIRVEGINFYQISSIMIGGNPVPESNYQVVAEDNVLELIVPADQPKGAGQSVVISTGIGISNTDVTITIY